MSEKENFIEKRNLPSKNPYLPNFNSRGNDQNIYNGRELGLRESNCSRIKNIHNVAPQNHDEKSSSPGILSKSTLEELDEGANSKNEFFELEDTPIVNENFALELRKNIIRPLEQSTKILFNYADSSKEQESSIPNINIEFHTSNHEKTTLNNPKSTLNMAIKDLNRKDVHLRCRSMINYPIDENIQLQNSKNTHCTYNKKVDMNLGFEKLAHFKSGQTAIHVSELKNMTKILSYNPKHINYRANTASHSAQNNPKKGNRLSRNNNNPKLLERNPIQHTESDLLTKSETRTDEINRMFLTQLQRHDDRLSKLQDLLSFCNLEELEKDIKKSNSSTKNKQDALIKINLNGFLMQPSYKSKENPIQILRSKKIWNDQAYENKNNDRQKIDLRELMHDMRTAPLKTIDPSKLHSSKINEMIPFRSRSNRGLKDHGRSTTIGPNRNIELETKKESESISVNKIANDGNHDYFKKIEDKKFIQEQQQKNWKGKINQ